MSYDLTLFRVPDGVDPALAYQQFAESQERDAADLDTWMKRPISGEARAEIRRVAEALKSCRPELQEFQPKSPRPWIELNDDELEIQIEIHDGSVSITIPYFRDRAEDVMACVTASFDTLAAAVGFSAYDPQLERFVTSADRSDMVAQYRQIDQALPAIRAKALESKRTGKKPWWKFW